MLWRQLFLVGFAILILPGTVEQLVICFLVALSHMLLHAVAMPFKDDGDNYFGQAQPQHFRGHPYRRTAGRITLASLPQACNFALTAVFFFLLVIKTDVLADSVTLHPTKSSYTNPALSMYQSSDPAPGPDPAFDSEHAPDPVTQLLTLTRWTMPSRTNSARSTNSTSPSSLSL